MSFDVTPESGSADPTGPSSDRPVTVPERMPALSADEAMAAPSSPQSGNGSAAGSPSASPDSPWPASASGPPPIPPSASRGRPGGDDFGGHVYAPPPQGRRVGRAAAGVLVTLLVIGGVGAALAAYGGGGSDKEPGHIYRVGQPADVGSLSFTVLGVRTIPATQFSEPKPGFTYIAVHIEVENHGQNTKPVSSFAQFAVRDATGLTYEQTFTGGLVGSLDGMLPPGSKLRGEIAYEVPASLAGLQMVISDFIFGGSATVQLT